MAEQIITSREQRQKDRFISKASQTAAKYLRRMEELSGAPEAMAPFFQVLRDIYVDGRDVLRENGVKTVGTYCVMAPQELIYAAGAVPVKLCSGSYTAFSILGRGRVAKIQCDFSAMLSLAAVMDSAGGSGHCNDPCICD